MESHVVQQALYPRVDGLFRNPVFWLAECLLEESGMVGIGTSRTLHEQIMVSGIVHEPLQFRETSRGRPQQGSNAGREDCLHLQSEMAGQQFFEHSDQFLGKQSNPILVPVVYLEWIDDPCAIFGKKRVEINQPVFLPSGNTERHNFF